MQVRFIGLLALGSTLVSSLGGGWRGVVNPSDQATQQPPSAVLVELFTSEGCSSCPPADALLARLETSQGIAEGEIVALKLHVDYWNRLGWTDRFSSPVFSQRQSEYAEVFEDGSVYTPQMVVDGTEGFVGSDERKARAAIERASKTPKARIQLEALRRTSTGAEGVRLRVHIAGLPGVNPGDTPGVFLAVTETNLSSQVTRGENAGRRLVHTAVVRNLQMIARVEPQREFTTEFPVPVLNDWKVDDLRAVVFVQEQHSRHVLGAAQVRLQGE
ncbi:MAG: DUF1223 domain-containing protein [Acidobacteria bacterium]|nr:DUF1223 domain-containing protein [Acidobacteriota bacterium]